MTKQQLIEAITVYRNKLHEIGVSDAIDYPHDKLLDTQEHSLEHCLGMFDSMEKFIEEDRLEKTFRWLGFIQGILWREGIYTLEELKDHNR